MSVFPFTLTAIKKLINTCTSYLSTACPALGYCVSQRYLVYQIKSIPLINAYSEYAYKCILCASKCLGLSRNAPFLCVRCTGFCSFYKYTCVTHRCYSLQKIPLFWKLLYKMIDEAHKINFTLRF
ncbi:hypothetical protein XELAEV_18044450mg [Xenopus laevis]|uniref:Uncharacterized protein n=1 Tax=Xenopus laevis TaxID=8355 RepID=A0A974BYU6_XENLA|nr:hypothetical protein XELAEV_18044450mg [Xenopus laevis]